MSDLTQWSYKRSHSITSATTLTDYQVKIRVYRTEGTSTGDTVYLGSKCLANYADIRFVASDGETELSYWMETNAGTYADFWVKVPSITTDSSIYIYYGNASATTTSNGDETFEFFDDFTGTTLDTSKWTKSQNGTLSITNGIFTTAASSNSINSIYSKTTFGINTALRIRASQTLVAYSWMGYTPSMWTHTNGVIQCSTAGKQVSGTYNSADEVKTITSPSASYQIYDIIRNGSTSAIFKINDVIKNTHSIQVSTSSLYIEIGSYASGSSLSIDYICLRKCTTTEPTQTPGTETELKSPLDGWTYKRSHEITGASLTDYQVKIIVNYGSGTSSGDTVYLDGKCKADFGDIRFTNNDDDELPYWIESSTAGSTATFWVKVDTLPSTIWLYYGNETASTTSNGNTTFEFFDDFSDNIYTDKWQDAGSSSNSTFTESNGTLKIEVTNYNYWGALKLVTPLTQGNYAVRSRAKISTYGSSIFGLKNDTNSISTWLSGTKCYCNIYRNGPKRSIHRIDTGTSVELISNTSTAVDTNYHVRELYTNGSTVYATYDDATTLSVASSTYTSFVDVLLIGTSNSGSVAGSGEYDWVIIRKYNASEPTQSTWSEEQEVTSYPLKITITPTTGNDPLSVSYNLSISDPLDDFTLNYGDGNVYTADDVTSFATTHIYDTPGTYTVWAKGYTEFATHRYYEIPYGVTVNSQPVVASFTTSQTYNIVQFTNTSTGNINECYWDFGDGRSSYEQNPVHTYWSPATYTVTLYASNQYQYDTFATTVTITQVLTPPEVYFTPNNLNVISPTLPYTVNFTNLSTPAFGCTYNWLIDGVSYTTVDTTHSFPSVGMYDVGLTVTNALGSATKTYNDAIRITRKGKTFYEVINYADTPATFHVEVFVEYATNTDTIVQAHIFDESINFVQDEIPDEPGLDEWGMRHFYTSINEWGHRIINAVTDWGHRILYNGSTLDNSPVTLFKAQEFREDLILSDEWQFGTT